VYKLGAVYLQLTKLLRIEDHPSLTRPIDPSLYIHRFVEKLEVPHATVRGGGQGGGTEVLMLHWQETGWKAPQMCVGCCLCM
jgi:transcription factor IIIB subunit 2